MCYLNYNLNCIWLFITCDIPQRFSLVYILAPPRVAHTSSPRPAPLAVTTDVTPAPDETVAKEASTLVQQTVKDVPVKEKTVVTSGKKNGEGKKGESSAAGFKPKVTLPYYMEPTYFIGGGNGVAL